MAITPITKPREVRRFVVYDLEWKAGAWQELDEQAVRVPQISMAGIFDGKAYRWYRSIDSFLNGELTQRNHGLWFYAHAGGLADMLFVLQRVIQHGSYEVKAAFSGSSAIIVHIKRGRFKWVFIDSLWLFGTALANIAKWIGLEKGTVDFETDDMDELAKYNRLDCEILWKSIDAFETAMLEIGGSLRMTLASCAMDLFRRKFLTKEVATNPEVNKMARQAYFGSRVEVFNRTAKNGFYYDINSSFPYAMTEPAPGSFIGTTARLPKKDDALYVADVTIEVPEIYFPPMPYRAEGSVFFPIGEWRGFLNNVDLRLLEATGGRILKVHEAVNFEPFYDLSAYAQTLYEKRRTGTTDFEKIVYKLLLNSLYGKFAENPLKSSLLVNPPFTDCPHNPPHARKPDDPREPLCMTQLIPGVWLLDQELEVPHEHVPISAHITALARKNLYEHMLPCDEFYYCDTDGFATNEPNLPTSDKLGGLKLELSFRDAEFLSPKVYRIDKKVKAKGMSLADKRQLPDGLSEIDRKERLGEIALSRWLKLREGLTVEAERMSRIKELYRSGSTVPVTRIIEKQLRFASRPKRHMFKDGSSEPWNVDVLEKSA